MIGKRLMAFALLAGAGLLAPLQPKESQSRKEMSSNYTYRVVASGLTNPTDIRIAGEKSLFIAHQPKAPRDASLAKLDLETGELTMVGAGPAVLSGFTANRQGRLYWVDGAKGVLMTQGGPGEVPRILHRGGSLPATAIAVDAADRVYLARTVPLQKGTDSAAVLARGSSLRSIADPGGPPKTALAASTSGDLYWTSSREGVIYHLSPDGRGKVIVSGLEKPQGIALNPSEDTLYFTEIPTPDLAADQGGRNTVNAVDLATMEQTIIHRGDPKPTAVTVAPNGIVYWTSSTRGLVVAAMPMVAPVIPVPQFSAALVGSEVVPPVVTQSQGSATFTLSTKTGDDTESRLRTSRSEVLNFQIAISDINNVRQVEIHEGDRGVVGALVAVLARRTRSEDDSESTDGFSLSGRIGPRDLKGPFAGDWAGFTSALTSGGLYVNVLTRTNPTGEVRGQIAPTGGDVNQAPTATITAPTAPLTTIQAGQSVSFAGTATDPNGDAVTVVWNFGDGTTSTSLTPGSHTYPVAGTFTVRLSATDAKGLGNTNPPTRTIVVQPLIVNQPPDAMITQPTANTTITAGQSVSFAGTASDPNGDVVTVLWEFGDGSTSTLLTPGAHIYSTAGTFTVRLTATDSQGLVDPTPSTVVITVSPVPPNRPPVGTITMPASNITTTVGQSVQFTGTATDPDGDAVTVLWNFGDGTTSTLLAPGSHTYTTTGTFTVTLTAKDAKGMTALTPATRTITVQAAPVNLPPNGTITAPAANITITAGQSVAFSGVATDPNGDAVTVLWNFGDGSTSALLVPGNHTYVMAGTYTVSLTAKDALGLSDPTPDTRTITVSPVVVATTLTQVQTTIFTPLCTGCHSSGGSAGLNLSAGSAFSNLVNVPATTLSGLRVVPGNPAGSALVTQLAGGHRSVSAANQALISSWISAGALNN